MGWRDGPIDGDMLYSRSGECPLAVLPVCVNLPIKQAQLREFEGVLLIVSPATKQLCGLLADE